MRKAVRAPKCLSLYVNVQTLQCIPVFAKPALRRHAEELSVLQEAWFGFWSLVSPRPTLDSIKRTVNQGVGEAPKELDFFKIMPNDELEKLEWRALAQRSRTVPAEPTSGIVETISPPVRPSYGRLAQHPRNPRALSARTSAAIVRADPAKTGLCGV
jgi:hypothetical protein